jgi:hypothetical protein
MTGDHPGNVSKKVPSSRWNASEIRGIATGNETCREVEDVDERIQLC